jgi:hypothetical protein
MVTFRGTYAHNLNLLKVGTRMRKLTMNPTMPYKRQNGMMNYKNIKKENNLFRFVTHTTIINRYAISTKVD